MTFVCSVKKDQKIHVTLLQRGNETISRAAVGYDDLNDDVISVFAALSPLPTGPEDGYELVFNIFRASPYDDDDVTEYWDGQATKSLISDAEHRMHVKAVINCCIQSLIDKASPKIVALSTHQPNLPEKALTKYNEICAVFSSNGYHAGRGDSYHGQHIWMISLP